MKRVARPEKKGDGMRRETAVCACGRCGGETPFPGLPWRKKWRGGFNASALRLYSDM